MRHSTTFLLCGGALVAGLILGAGLGSPTWTGAVQAQPLDSATSERLYRELQDTSAFQDGSNLLAKIAAVSTPAVVHIQSERRIPGRGREEETGSGVIMNSVKVPGFYVVTNAHVVDKTSLESISIHLNDGRLLQPERVWADPQTDVAVLKINAPNLSAARWGDSQKLDIGHMVLAMGSPFGLSRSVTFGIISAKGRRQLKLGQSSEVLNQDFLQTDAAINPGNSGGPLIDMQGRVVGINTAIASSSGGNEGIGFSIPSHLVQRVMEQLLEHGVVSRAWIGVKLDDKFDGKVAARLRLDRVLGTRVSEVFPNSPAARSGLQYDDVILTFDTTEVQDHDHLINLVSLSPIGKRIQMIVWRGGKKINLFIVLADRSELPPNSEGPPPEIGIPVRTMGLTVHPLDNDLADQLGHDRTTHGLLILSVDKNSPLGKRLHPYDVIEAVGRTPVANLDDLDRALDANSERDSIVLRVHRGDPSESGLEEQLVVWKRTPGATVE
ncbi:MAG: trypsin-like peptidase domain-containing protein [Planctomycetes bacterium]|nr:trypsin-like peptidase domain-containing protein [Planctomycetota bacterium]